MPAAFVNFNTMTGETNKLKIKLKTSEISQEESDRALFTLFDFLLSGNEQVDTSGEDRNNELAKKQSHEIEI